MLTSKKRAPSGRHKFDVRCKVMSIEHRLCPPRHPQTNGMVERFNGCISEEVKQTRFTSAAELEATLDHYLKTYNHLVPQRALNHLSPVQALKKWQAEKPDLFVKRVYNQPGLESFARPPIVTCRAATPVGGVPSYLLLTEGGPWHYCSACGNAIFRGLVVELWHSAITALGRDHPVNDSQNAFGASSAATPMFDDAALRATDCDVVTTTIFNPGVELHFGVQEPRETHVGSIGVLAAHRLRLDRGAAVHLEEVLTRVLGASPRIAARSGKPL